jgi:hypothetical protein
LPALADFFLIATQTRQILHFFFSRQKFPTVGGRLDGSDLGHRAARLAEPSEKYFCKMVDIVKSRD